MRGEFGDWTLIAIVWTRHLLVTCPPRLCQQVVPVDDMYDRLALIPAQQQETASLLFMWA